MIKIKENFLKIKFLFLKLKYNQKRDFMCHTKYVCNSKSLKKSLIQKIKPLYESFTKFLSEN